MSNGKVILIFAVVFAIGAIMFLGSFSLVSDLSEQEGWVETTATVTYVEFSTYENFNEEAILEHREPRFWGEEHVTYEFTREDGSEGSGTWWRRGLDTRDESVFTAEGDIINIIYDPYSDASEQGYLPDTSSYAGAYVMRVLGALVAIASAAICIYFWVNTKKNTAEGDK